MSINYFIAQNHTLTDTGNMPTAAPNMELDTITASSHNPTFTQEPFPGTITRGATLSLSAEHSGDYQSLLPETADYMPIYSIVDKSITPTAPRSVQPVDSAATSAHHRQQEALSRSTGNYTSLSVDTADYLSVYTTVELQRNKMEEHGRDTCS